jgi:hypothetical protein
MLGSFVDMHEVHLQLKIAFLALWLHQMILTPRYYKGVNTPRIEQRLDDLLHRSAGLL